MNTHVVAREMRDWLESASSGVGLIPVPLVTKWLGALTTSEPVGGDAVGEFSTGPANVVRRVYRDEQGLRCTQFICECVCTEPETMATKIAAFLNGRAAHDAARVPAEVARYIVEAYDAGFRIARYGPKAIAWARKVMEERGE